MCISMERDGIAPIGDGQGGIGHASTRSCRGYSDRVSMDGMFEDLEGRLAHLEDQQIRAEAEELARAERSQVSLRDRLRAADGMRLVVHLVDGSSVAGPLAELGADWLLLGEDPGAGTRVLVPLAAVTTVEGLPARVRPETHTRIPPRSLGSVLRRAVRDRESVRIRTLGGTVSGALVSSGEDFIDLAGRPPGEPAARSGRGTLLTVPVGAVVVIAFE